MLNWTVEKTEENFSLLDYLQLKIAQSPTSYLRQLIRSGKVQYNGSIAPTEQSLRYGDTISVPESRRLLEFLTTDKMQPPVLFESDKILIVHKPSGLATHSSKNHEQDNLVVRVSQMMLKQEKQFKVAAAHRLDLPTSGPVIFGKGQKAISRLGSLMQENLISKKYLALVSSGLPEKGLLSSFVTSKGKIKYAETRFRILEQHSNLALLELELETGRQHQIRKQLAKRGHPVAGDNRYQGLTLQNLNRLFLHCHFLDFQDPFNAEQITITDPLPTDLSQLLTMHGFSCP